MISPLYRGVWLCSPGVIWSVFSCLALHASSAMTGLRLRASPKRVLLGALAPVVAYSAAGFAALLLMTIPLADKHLTGVLVVSVSFLVFTAGIAVMLRVWSRRIDTRTWLRAPRTVGLMALVFNAVLEGFDQPAFGAHSFQLLLVVAVSTVLFVVTGRGVVRAGVLGDVRA